MEKLLLNNYYLWISGIGRLEYENVSIWLFTQQKYLNVYWHVNTLNSHILLYATIKLENSFNFFSISWIQRSQFGILQWNNPSIKTTDKITLVKNNSDEITSENDKITPDKEIPDEITPRKKYFANKVTKIRMKWCKYIEMWIKYEKKCINDIWGSKHFNEV